MKDFINRFLTIFITIVMFWLLSANPIVYGHEDSFAVEVDANGMAVGSGSGYNGGAWYWYENSEWWCQWFYNGYHPTANKGYRIRFSIRPITLGQPSYAKVYVNWSTNQWLQQDPPLPGDVVHSLAYENQVIGRDKVYDNEPPDSGQAFGTSLWPIPVNYCPTWISIDVKGYNFKITNAYIEHECSEEPVELPQACCFLDGTCEDLTPQECYQRMGNAQGPGTLCATTQCPSPPITQACCFLDGSCEDLTPQECYQRMGNSQGGGTSCATTNCPLPQFDEACCLPDGSCVVTDPLVCQFIGGMPQGYGSNCGTVDCTVPGDDCTWTIEQSHKMHWPQMPKTGGWDVDFASSVLADDWQCSQSGPVEDIHFWISWRGNMTAPVDLIKVAIYADIPDPDGAGPGYSMPGQLLWEDLFHSEDFIIRNMPDDLQGWLDPLFEVVSPQDHDQWQQIDICRIPNPFIQEQGNIYWLAVSFPGLSETRVIGWKESDNHFNDGAVWLYRNSGPWLELRDPLTVEKMDLAFVITGGGEELAELPHLKWEQPPIEWDPLAKTPTFCGWDEPSYVIGTEVGVMVPRTWLMVADDFRCLGSMPITSVHWWGSYLNWDSTVAPVFGPNQWRIGFWTNVAPSTSVSYSYPRKLLWIADVDAQDVTIDYVGFDKFIDTSKPQDTCFKYSVHLKPEQVFWQDRYLSDTDDNIFWISITALYHTDTIPQYPWGWKTRPAHWMDDAVTFPLQQFFVNVNMFVNADQIIPIKSNQLCGESFDMAFALDTDPNYIKWEQPFTGLRDWEHYEDVKSFSGMAKASSIATKWQQDLDTLQHIGLAVDATRDIPKLQDWDAQVLADDFECTSGGPITGIDIWGSWYSDIGDANKVGFKLCIHEDIPASLSSTGYSMPGKVLWSKTFNEGDYSIFPQSNQTQSYYSACNSFYQAFDHKHIYQYSFGVDPCEAFIQQGTTNQPVVYWLSVQANVFYAPSSLPQLLRRFGWNTSETKWNDAAVWAQARSPYEGTWQKLAYPSYHTYFQQKQLDLAFQITTSSQSSSEIIQRQVADDWQCSSWNPITAVTWWGSYIDHKYQTCQCQVLPEPNRPDYFLLTIWSDVPDPNPSDPSTFSRPDELIWQYRAKDYDEVMVGFDKHPEDLHIIPGREAVYRYSVRLPRDNWFYQTGRNNIYWFSVVAVYDRDVSTVKYPWGWTNHPKVFNDNAVAGSYSPGFPSSDTLKWEPLFDQIGGNADMSFMLFTDPNQFLLGEPPIDPN